MSRPSFRILIAIVVLAAVGLGLGAWWLGDTGTPPPSRETPDASLERAPDAYAPVDVRAAQGGMTLAGKVQDRRGQPVAGARVSLVSTHQAHPGSVRCAACAEPLLSCPAGETAGDLAEWLTKSVSHAAALTVESGADGTFRFEGLSGTSFSLWAESDGAGRAVLEHAAPGETAVLELETARRLEGVLRSEDRKPVRDARVWLISHRVPVTDSAAVVNEGGTFSFEAVGEGPYSLLVAAPGFASKLVTPVTADGALVPVVLQRTRSVEVRVTHEGKPAAGAKVTLGHQHLRRVETTGKDGRVRFVSLAPAEVSLRASLGTLAALRDGLSVLHESASIELALEPEASLVLTLVDDDGAPVPDPRAALFSHEQVQLAEKFGREGEPLEMNGLVPGNYEVRLSAPGFGTQNLSLTLPPGETRNEWVMERRPRISGRVVDEYGRPAERVGVFVDTAGRSFDTDSEGRFTADVPSPGTYTLQAHHSDWGGGKRVVEAPASDVEITLDAQAGVQVTLTSGGQPVEGGVISLGGSDGAAFRSDRTSDRNGLVRLRGIPAGTYQLVGAHERYASPPPQMVTLSDGALTSVTLELPRGRVLHGEVVDGEGKPLSGASLRLGGSAARAPIFTDSEGRFRLEGLPERLSYLQVIHPDFLPKVMRGHTVTEAPLRVELERRQRFRGRVLSARTGAPLKRFRLDSEWVESPDGRFEHALPSSKEKVAAMVEAPGHLAEFVERDGPPTDLGDIRLQPSEGLRGRVVENGVGVAGALVRCDECDANVLTREDGRFDLPGPTTREPMTLVATQRNRTVTRRFESAPKEEVELVLVAAVKVEGIVRGPDGAPLAGAPVAVVSMDGQEPRTWVTGPDGRFSGEAPAGNYSLMASVTRSWRQTRLFTEFTGAQVSVLLGAGHSGRHPVDVRFSRPRSGAFWLLSGTVSAPQPQDIGKLQRTAYGQLAVSMQAPGIRFEGVPPGTYTLVFGEENGRSLTAVPVRVPQSSPLELPVGGAN